ncbi:hypothetical protein OG320_10805 [Microbispora sp. NBC_01189]|uniref:hypothetical protein n=1 Tax=Microbispora sp. NBC_01189 TaxID=2903583 RepID=UPI002E0D1141|nr:hypothetical protein OG320_10805 [Microbispora sp. NBC_01189]
MLASTPVPTFTVTQRVVVATSFPKQIITDGSFVLVLATRVELGDPQAGRDQRPETPGV